MHLWTIFSEGPAKMLPCADVFLLPSFDLRVPVGVTPSMLSDSANGNHLLRFCKTIMERLCSLKLLSQPTADRTVRGDDVCSASSGEDLSGSCDFVPSPRLIIIGLQCSQLCAHPEELRNARQRPVMCQRIECSDTVDEKKAELQSLVDAALEDFAPRSHHQVKVTVAEGLFSLSEMLEYLLAVVEQEVEAGRVFHGPDTQTV